MPSFRGQSDLQVDFDANVDTELLEASVNGVNKSAQKLTETFKQTNAVVKQSVDATEAAGKEVKDSTRETFKWRDAFDRVHDLTGSVRNTIALINKGLSTTFSTIQKAGQITRARQGLFNLGADAQAIERFDKILGGTVSKLEIAQSLKGAVSSGFSPKELDDMGRTTAFMAAKLSVSKSEMLGMLKNAELTDDQLKVINLSTAKLEDLLGDAADKQRGALTETQSRAVKLRAIIEATRRTSEGFTKSTKDAGDEGDKVLATFTNLKNELARNLLPIANQLLGTVNRWLKGINTGLDALRGRIGDQGQLLTAMHNHKFERIGQVLKDVEAGKHSAEVFEGQLSAIGQRFNAILAAGKGSTSIVQAVFGKKVEAKQANEVVGAMREIAAVSDKLFKNRENRRFGGVVLAPKDLKDSQERLKDLFAFVSNALKPDGKKKASKFLGVTDATREAKEELRGFRSEARSMLRNFDANFTDLVSNLGGSFSGVISAMKEIPEKFRILGSLPELREGISKTLGMSVQQIDAQKTQLKLSEDQVKAAKLFSVALQAGKFDIEEYIGNEKAVNHQLRAGISLLSSQAKIASVLVEQNNLKKDVAASGLTIDLMRTPLLVKEVKLRTELAQAMVLSNSKAVKDLTTQLQLNQYQLKTLDSAAKRYKEIGKERAKILEIQKKQAIIEKAGEIQGKLISIDKQRNEMLKTRVGLMNEIRSFSGGQSEISLINEATAQRIRDATIDIKELTNEATVLQGKLAQGTIDQAEVGFARQQLKLLKDKIKARKEDIILIQGARDAQIHSLTVVGQLQQRFADTARAHNAELANNIISMSQETIGATGGIITTFFSDLATNQENALATAGKSFLQVLAGMAGKLAAFYITSGTAQLFVPPYTGAGAIAAGAALAALAGGLGVASSVIDTGGGGGAGASASAGRVPNIQTRLPGLERPERNEPKREYFLINGAPFLGSDGQMARKWVRWMEREGRNQKGRDVRVFN